MVRIIIPVIGILFWLYGLSVLHRAKTAGFYFWWGCIGLFIILANGIHTYLFWGMPHLVTSVMAIVANATHWFTVNLSDNLLNVAQGHTRIQIFINYECSGVIEFVAYESMLIFYPIYHWWEKLLLSFAGILWILLANVCRLGIVLLIIEKWGSSYLFVAHAFIGRLFFYFVVIILYYTVFTRSQLVKGGLGRNR